MRQTNAAVPIKPFMILVWYWHNCIALRVLRYASQFVTLLAAHTAFVTAAPVSFMPPHSFRPSFRYITPRSQLCRCSFHGFPPANTQIQPTAGSTFHFATPTLQYSLGSIIAPLRPSFISVGFSPPAANNFACLACLPQRLVCHGFLTHNT